MKKKLRNLSMFFVLVFSIGLLAACSPGEEANDIDEDTTEETAEDVYQDEYDVIVVGGGGAGLASAVEAKEAGAEEVLLVEVLPRVGGSTLLSGGIFYGNSPDATEEDAEELLEYWMEHAEGNADEDLLAEVAKESGNTLQWLMDLGIEFNDPMPAPGEEVLRTHITENFSGNDFIEPLTELAKDLGVDMMLSTRAEKLIQDDEDNVIGIEAMNEDDKTISVHSKAVVLTTGGFDQSEEMREEYAPVSAGHLTYVSPENKGDGIKMGREVDAEIIAKNAVLGDRTVAENLPFDSPINMLMRDPELQKNIYIDGEGRRFIDETTDYRELYREASANGSDTFYIITDSDNHNEAFDEAFEKEVAFKADRLEDLANQLDVDETNFVETVTQYNEMIEDGKDTEFGKDAEALDAVDAEKYYALPFKPITMGTFGGLKINEKAEVLREDNSTIRGLYAAGEVANGQLFSQYYPQSGNSIAMVFHFGREAGTNAANFAQ